MSLRMVIMAGGTGGHVFPALAVAERLRDEGVEVSWMGTRRGLEAKVVPAHGFPIDWVEVGGLRGKGLGRWLGAPWQLLRALGQALAILRRRRAHLVLGMGGFVTGPGGVAARLLGRPLLIHEQNRIPGLTNRLLKPLARRVLCGFPGTFPESERVVVTGNPVREAFARIPAPRERLAERRGRPRLLVVGGSLGAAFFNETVPRALARLPEARRPHVHHQCGERHLEATRRAYAEAGVEAEVMPFIEDMAAAYHWSDLVLCRAGALTVSELAVAGAAAILVPYPYAVDDHQSANARYLADAGAAVLVQQRDLDAERLGALLEERLSDRDALLAMAEKARALGRPEATALVTDLCLVNAHV